jgi:predicted DNA-binding transcriptional regulator AlpA
MRRLMYFKDLKPERGINYSREWIAKLVKRGEFPAPLKMGRRRPWDTDHIDAYLASLPSVEREVV